MILLYLLYQFNNGDAPMKTYVMLLKYFKLEWPPGSIQFNKVEHEENFRIEADCVEYAMFKAKEWCIKNRRPYNNEVVVRAIFSE